MAVRDVFAGTPNTSREGACSPLIRTAAALAAARYPTVSGLPEISSKEAAVVDFASQNSASSPCHAQCEMALVFGLDPLFTAFSPCCSSVPARPRHRNRPQPKPALPADTPFNKGAGRGNPLYITLHLESGEKLLFEVDTGSPGTCLDKSLEPKLGQRVSSTIGWYGYYRLSWEHVYHAPALYLGSTRLVTSDRICTDDLRTKSRPGHPIMGILGMDFLRHYCLQLDLTTTSFIFLILTI